MGNVAAKMEPLPIIQSRRDVLFRVIDQYLCWRIVVYSPASHDGGGVRRRANKERQLQWRI